MTMNTTQKFIAGLGTGVLLAMATIATMYAAGCAFLIVNKRNPMATEVTSIVTYWRAYQDDPRQAKRLIGCIGAAAGLFFVVLPVGLYVAAQKKRPLHGEARFANTSEIMAAKLLSGKGILVGQYHGKYLSLNDQRFVLLAAPTRSGKGVGVVIPNLLNWSDSVVVLDIKGENFAITSGFRARHGQKVYAFQPFDEEGITHRYNPFGYVRKEPRFRVGDLQMIGATFFPVPTKDDGDSSAKFWNDKARDLFVGLALYLMETPKLPTTLGELLRQSSGKGKTLKEHLQTVIAERDKTDVPLSPECVESLDRFLSNPDNTLGNIISTFTAPLLIFADQLVDAATSANDFSIEDLRRKRISIYVVIPPPKLAVAGELINLFFSQVVALNTRTLPPAQSWWPVKWTWGQRLMKVFGDRLPTSTDSSATKPGHDSSLRYQCLLLMDEFTAMGRVAILSKGVSYLAGYNLRFLTIVQSKAQLAGVYGNEGAKTFADNHALQILFAPKDQEDSREFSQWLGNSTEKVDSVGRSRSLAMSGHSTASTNTAEHARPLMLPQELREMGMDLQIIMLEQCKPILCNKIRYFADPVFQKRLMPAVALPQINHGLHEARLRQRVRNAEDSDFLGALDLSVLAHDFESVEPPPPMASAEEISAYVDNFFQCFETTALPPVDTDEALDLNMIVGSGLDDGEGVLIGANYQERHIDLAELER